MTLVDLVLGLFAIGAAAVLVPLRLATLAALCEHEEPEALLRRPGLSRG